MNYETAYKSAANRADAAGARCVELEKELAPLRARVTEYLAAVDECDARVPDPLSEDPAVSRAVVDAADRAEAALCAEVEK